MFIHRYITNFTENIETVRNSIILTGIAILILGIFTLTYKNVLLILNHLFQLNKVSVVLKIDSSLEDIEDVINEINSKTFVKNFLQVETSGIKEELFQNFENITQELKNLNLQDFPPFLEFTVHGGIQKVQNFINRLSDHRAVQKILTGKNASQQIATIIKIIDIIGIIFLFLLGISIYFMIYHSIQITIYSQITRINILMILGATRSFIRGPYVFLGLVIVLAGSALGILILYIFYQFAISFITLNENSFFIREYTRFFEPPELLMFSLIATVISYIAVRKAIYRILDEKKIL